MIRLSATGADTESKNILIYEKLKDFPFVVLTAPDFRVACK